MKGKPSKPLSLTKDEWRRLVVEGIVSVKQAREWWLISRTSGNTTNNEKGEAYATYTSPAGGVFGSDSCTHLGLNRD